MKKNFFISFAVLALILFVFEKTDWDIKLQDCFFDGGWLISARMHQKLSPFFYRGFKIFTASVGAVCLFCFLLPFKKEKLRRYRASVLMLLLSLIFVPVIVAGGKQVTNQYCPKHIVRYGGPVPYVGVFESYPKDFVQIKKGKCFPAGHATSGFAFMGLFFCFASRKKRIAGLVFGIIAGWIAGTYQMFRGEHFLSHTLVSMTASWIVVSAIYCLLKRFYKDPANVTHADNN